VSQVLSISRDDMLGGDRPVAAVRYTSADSGPRRAPVAHSHAALAFYTGGSSRMNQDGEWHITAGDVLLVPAGKPHRLLQSRRPEYWVLTFSVPCFAADDVATVLEPLERVRDGASAVVQIPAARHGFLEGLLREMEERGRAPEDRGAALHVVQRSLLTLIMNEVDRAARRVHTSGLRGGGVVVDSLRFIERNCLRRLTLDEVAAAVGRSPAHVTSALTKATRRSAGAWILSGRLAEARRRLLHSDEMVDVIAERVGYADATHFIRMFRRHHGATPAAWRAAQLARATGASR
jgi:AraC family transcriptional regulator, transcriptional activator of pobA